jgi:hypothetical protein
MPKLWPQALFLEPKGSLFPPKLRIGVPYENGGILYVFVMKKKAEAMPDASGIPLGRSVGA